MLRRTLFFTFLTLAVASFAEARDETVRWTHPLGPQVASFHIYVGSSAGTSDLMDQSVGLPSVDTNGIYSTTITLTTEDTIFVRMTAVDANAVASTTSNEISRSVPLGTPGTPVVAIP